MDIFKWFRKKESVPKGKGLEFCVTHQKSNTRYQLWRDGSLLIDTYSKKKYSKVFWSEYWQ